MYRILKEYDRDSEDQSIRESFVVQYLKSGIFGSKWKNCMHVVYTSCDSVWTTARFTVYNDAYVYVHNLMQKVPESEIVWP